MESIRQQKIARLLQKQIGEIFSRNEVVVLKGSMISITQCRVTPDLGIAKLYVSIFPVDDKQEAIEELQSQASEIRYVLGRKVGKQLRHIPELHFYLDDSFDYAEKIDELLK
ncbi:MAG: 30S ribosome-binding factor RbfA [Vicingaceae bacterium]